MLYFIPDVLNVRIPLDLCPLLLHSNSLSQSHKHTQHTSKHIYVHCLFTDYLLWGQKFPRALLWVQQWLPWAQLPLQSLQLHQGGERGVGGLRAAQLHGLTVCPDKRGVPRLPALDGLQRHHQVLPLNPKRESHSLKRDHSASPYTDLWLLRVVFDWSDILSSFQFSHKQIQKHTCTQTHSVSLI